MPRRKAAKALTRYLELHPVNIEQVVSVIIEHFRLYVMHEIGGRAKAMVVTGSRLAASRGQARLRPLRIKDHGYTGIRSLVAFSGTVEDPDNPGSCYTEVSMNGGIAESALSETFERDDYRVLIVAETDQYNGFDQPLLQTMYVVKRLAGVQAVQTAAAPPQSGRPRQDKNIRSRLRERGGRHLPGVQALLRARTPIGENADPHRLSELQHKLLEWAIVRRQRPWNGLS